MVGVLSEGGSSKEENPPNFLGLPLLLVPFPLPLLALPPFSAETAVNRREVNRALRIIMVIILIVALLISRTRRALVQADDHMPLYDWSINIKVLSGGEPKRFPSSSTD